VASDNLLALRPSRKLGVVLLVVWLFSKSGSFPQTRVASLRGNKRPHDITNKVRKVRKGKVVLVLN
jgi:hypothetical protein